MVSSNFVADLKQDALFDLGALKVKTFRREQSKFFQEFNEWMKNANVGEVKAFAQSESNGWITLTMCYAEHRNAEQVALHPVYQLLDKTASAVNDALILIDEIAGRLKLYPQDPPKNLRIPEDPVDSLHS